VAPAPTTGDAASAPTVAPVATDGALSIAAPDASGGAATDSGSGAGAGTGENGPAPTDAVQTAGQTAPTTSTAPVARTEGATGAAVAHPVSGQIAKHVAVLRGGPDGSHTMTVVLTPESLGPVEVSVTVSRGAIELTLRGAHEHGHAALLDAVPDLRRDLEAAGLTCSRLDVDRGSRDGGWSSSQQNAGRPGEQGQSGRGSQHDRPDSHARPWHRSADRGDGPRATTRTASGLDVRV
jgi:flagellar hook-length control protein FliK